MTPRLTEQQFDTLNTLNLLVTQIEDALGAESTNAGLVLLTQAQDIQAAVEELTPEGYLLRTIETSDLVADYLPPGDSRGQVLQKLLAMDTCGPTAGLCGGARFKPDAPDRGSFFVIIFLHVLDIAGFNMLVAFSRAET